MNYSCLARGQRAPARPMARQAAAVRAGARRAGARRLGLGLVCLHKALDQKVGAPAQAFPLPELCCWGASLHLRGVPAQTNKDVFGICMLQSKTLLETPEEVTYECLTLFRRPDMQR